MKCATHRRVPLQVSSKLNPLSDVSSTSLACETEPKTSTHSLVLKISNWVDVTRSCISTVLECSCVTDFPNGETKNQALHFLSLVSCVYGFKVLKTQHVRSVYIVFPVVLYLLFKPVLKRLPTFRFIRRNRLDKIIMLPVAVLHQASVREDGSIPMSQS